MIRVSGGDLVVKYGKSTKVWDCHTIYAADTRIDVRRDEVDMIHG